MSQTVRDEKMAGILFNTLHFEESLTVDELSTFREAYRIAVDAVARHMGYQDRDDMVESLMKSSEEDFLIRVRAIHQEVKVRSGGSMARFLQHYYGGEPLPAGGLITTIFCRVKELVRNAENELMRAVMEILYGCVTMAACAVR